MIDGPPFGSFPAAFGAPFLIALDFVALACFFI
jgi:hypothetical protein